MSFTRSLDEEYSHSISIQWAAPPTAVRHADAPYQSANYQCPLLAKSGPEQVPDLLPLTLRKQTFEGLISAIEGEADVLGACETGPLVTHSGNIGTGTIVLVKTQLHLLSIEGLFADPLSSSKPRPPKCRSRPAARQRQSAGR